MRMSGSWTPGIWERASIAWVEAVVLVVLVVGVIESCRRGVVNVVLASRVFGLNVRVRHERASTHEEQTLEAMPHIAISPP